MWDVVQVRIFRVSSRVWEGAGLRVWVSNREEAAFLASIVELSRRVSIAAPSKPPFSRLELTISRLSQRLMRTMLGKNRLSSRFDAY